MAGSKDDSVDTERLYGRFQNAEDEDRSEQRKRRRFFNRVLAKSLNMKPDAEDDEVNVNTQQGITWKELAVIGGMVVGGYGVFNHFSPQITPAPQIPPAFQPPVFQPSLPPIEDREYDVRFYDRNGNLIDVQPLPSSLQGGQ